MAWKMLSPCALGSECQLPECQLQKPQTSQNINSQNVNFPEIECQLQKRQLRKKNFMRGSIHVHVAKYVPIRWLAGFDLLLSNKYSSL